MKVFDAVKDKINGRDVWDYKIHSPLSLDDELEICVVIVYGKTSSGDREEYVLKFGGKE